MQRRGVIQFAASPSESRASSSPPRPATPSYRAGAARSGAWCRGAGRRPLAVSGCWRALRRSASPVLTSSSPIASHSGLRRERVVRECVSTIGASASSGFSRLPCPAAVGVGGGGGLQATPARRREPGLQVAGIQAGAAGQVIDADEGADPTRARHAPSAGLRKTAGHPRAPTDRRLCVAVGTRSVVPSQSLALTSTARSSTPTPAICGHLISNDSQPGSLGEPVAV